MELECKTYKLKDEFFKLLNIPVTQYKNRKEDLIDWLSNFYEFSLNETNRPITITITEIYDNPYSPMPPKSKIRKIYKEAHEDYQQYVKDNLSIDWKLESGSHMSRKAIKNFGGAKYSHSDENGVTRRYVMPAMKEFGEKSEEYTWCLYSDYDDYKPLTEEMLAFWEDSLHKNKVDADYVYSAFTSDNERVYRRMSKSGIKMNSCEDALAKYQDFTKTAMLQGNYIYSMAEFEGKYGAIPVRVPKWRLKNAAD